jgi:sterol desaturase/sphingolipid hydroxylase (fatty acid hydroxylase superfamily)
MLLSRPTARAGLVLGWFAALMLAEVASPLRRSREAKGRRLLRNLAIAGLGSIAQSVEQRVSQRLAKHVQRRRWGLIQQLDLSPAVELAAGLAALDYTLFVWHVLTHRVPLLWRFHAVHHADRDLDASTALRFHAAELALSIPWRAAQVSLLGITPRVLSAWQTALMMSVLFHHSNLKLGARFERWLGYLIATPRLHGIHHSIRSDERDSNWSSGFSLWDRLHGTFRADVPARAITIGLPEKQRADSVTIGKLLQLT